MLAGRWASAAARWLPRQRLYSLRILPHALQQSPFIGPFRCGTLACCHICMLSESTAYLTAWTQTPLCIPPMQPNTIPMVELPGGGEIDLIRRVELAIAGPLTRAPSCGAASCQSGGAQHGGEGRGVGKRTCRTDATLACRACRLHILSGGPVARAFAGGPGTARAARSLDCVLPRRLVAGAVERRLLATRAGGLLGWKKDSCQHVTHCVLASDNS